MFEASYSKKVADVEQALVVFITSNALAMSLAIQSDFILFLGRPDAGG